MPTIALHSEHLDGFADLLTIFFENGCDERDADTLREIIALRDQVGWDAARLAAGELAISEQLLAKMATYAWQAGNGRLADFYDDRARHGGTGDEDREATARSMLAFHEHMRGQKVVS